MNIPVFMYHAFYEQSRDLSSADHYYAKSFNDFRQHVNICITNDFKISSIQNVLKTSVIEENICCFTFDDGHESNYLAAQILHEYGFSADFFVNSNNIGKKDFLDDAQLIDMNKMGMSIQSHSHTHVYLEDLSREEAKNQLLKSKKIISEILGKEVTIFCPPGGRISQNNVKDAIDSGYLCITNSKPGVWKDLRKKYDVPRLVILNKTNNSQFLKLLRSNTVSLTLLKVKYIVTKLAKIIFGNTVYDILRNMVFRLLKFAKIK